MLAEGPPLLAHQDRRVGSGDLAQQASAPQPGGHLGEVAGGQLHAGGVCGGEEGGGELGFVAGAVDGGGAGVDVGPAERGAGPVLEVEAVVAGLAPGAQVVEAVRPFEERRRRAPVDDCGCGWRREGAQTGGRGSVPGGREGGVERVGDGVDEVTGEVALDLGEATDEPFYAKDSKVADVLRRAVPVELAGEDEVTAHGDVDAVARGKISDVVGQRGEPGEALGVVVFAGHQATVRVDGYRGRPVLGVQDGDPGRADGDVIDVAAIGCDPIVEDTPAGGDERFKGRGHHGFADGTLLVVVRLLGRVPRLVGQPFGRRPSALRLCTCRFPSRHGRPPQFQPAPYCSGQSGCGGLRRGPQGNPTSARRSATERVRSRCIAR